MSKELEIRADVQCRQSGKKKNHLHLLRIHFIKVEKTFHFLGTQILEAALFTDLATILAPSMD